MKFAESIDYKYSTVVRHQGMSIVLAMDENCDIYYRALAVNPIKTDDDKCWSNTMKLSFADQIRPAGMSLVTVDQNTADKTADAPFQAVSDGKHVYLFRQSIDNTLYVDRFVFDEAQKSLNPNCEARFQRNRKRDIPASRKDTLEARDMEGELFYEPTTELTMINDVQDGCFCLLLLPGRLPNEWRWQIFILNSEGEIDSFSIGRGEDGLFDVDDVKRTCLKWSDSRERFQAGPAALLYMRQEEAQDGYGRTQRLKREARIMLASPVGASRYALEFDGVNDYVEMDPVSIPATGNSFTIESWIKPADGYGITDKDHVAIVNIDSSDGVSHAGVLLGLNSSGNLILLTQIGSESSELVSTLAIPDNEWSHIAGVMENGNLQIFINGSADTSLSDAKTPQLSSYLMHIGTDMKKETHYKGQINNVRMWSCARTEEEILSGMHHRPLIDEPDLLGDWSFDEGSGDIVYNHVSENHGRLHVGCFLELDGKDDHVELPEMNPDFSTGFTIEAWVRYNLYLTVTCNSQECVYCLLMT